VGIHLLLITGVASCLILHKHLFPPSTKILNSEFYGFFQVAQPPPIPGSAQPPRMFGMPPLLPNQMTAISPVIGQTGSPLSGASKIDPNQIPRPIPGSSVILHDTRAGNQANPPPVSNSV
jgi:hypothetical protein